MIDVIERSGVDDATVVGRWDEDRGWVDGAARLDFENSEHYTEDMMLDRFDGPTLFAVPSEGSDTEKDRVGPPQATLLGVGDDVTVVDEEDEEEREKAEGRVYVDRLVEAPDDAIVRADVDEDGDVIDLYYEP